MEEKEAVCSEPQEHQMGEVIDLCSQELSPSPKAAKKDAFAVMMARAQCKPSPTLPVTKRNAFALMMTGARSLAAASKQGGKGPKGSDMSEESSPRTSSKGKKKRDFGLKARVNSTPGWAPPAKKIQVGEMRYPIVVDGFQFAHPQLSDTYFLTHFHADHYIGLEPGFDAGKIYCTPSTARLVKLRLKLRNTHLLVPLELEREYPLVVAGAELNV